MNLMTENRSAGAAAQPPVKKKKKKGQGILLPLLCCVLAVLFIVSTFTSRRLLKDLKAEEEKNADLVATYEQALRAAQNEKGEALSRAAAISEQLNVQLNELEQAKKDLAALTEERDSLQKTLADTDPIHRSLEEQIERLNETVREKQEAYDALFASVTGSDAGRLGFTKVGELVRSAPVRTEQITRDGEDGFPVVTEEEVTPPVALYYMDLNGGLSLSYGEELSFAAGDLTGLAQALYLLENEWDTLTGVYPFDPADAVSGSGILKNQEEGTEFTRLRLIELVLRYNDATASHVLEEIYGTDGTSALLESLGCGELAEGTATLESVSRLWLEIMRFAYAAEPGSASLRDSLVLSVTSGMSALFPGERILHRYTQSTGAYHDMGIVLGDRPFLLIVLTDMGYAGESVRDYLNELESSVMTLHRNLA